jgi:NDP-sugar pyrophosphorylase family protein
MIIKQQIELPPVAILMGGLATRLRPITEAIPKALVNIEGEPFVFYQLRRLRDAGIKEVVLCVGHRGEMIEEVVGNGSNFDLSVHYSHDGDQLLGTGGAIVKALPLLAPVFFVLYGDSYLNISYRDVYKAFLKSEKPALMVVFCNEGQWDKSNVHFECGMVQNYTKNRCDATMRYIDYGLAILQASVFHGRKPTDAFDIATAYEELSLRKELAGYEAFERFYEVGSFKGLEELRHLIQERRGNHGISK